MAKSTARSREIPNSGLTFQSFVTKHIDLLIIAGICLYGLFTWWPTRNLPYHWDSAGYIINAARQILITNFHTLATDFSAYAHPPLLPFFLAFIWKLFGEQALWSHLLMLPFVPILMISTYYLGKRVAHWQVGLAASILVGCIPVVLSEYGVIYVDLPEGALLTAGLALWVYHRYWLAGIVLALGLLMKFLGLIILPCLIIFLLLQPDLRKQWRHYVPLLIPILSLATWFLYHYLITHWWLVKPGIMEQFPVKGLSDYFNVINYIFQVIFWQQGRWLLTLLGIGSVSYLMYQRKIWHFIKDPLILSLGLYIISTIGFFTVVMEFGPRYIIFIFPSIFVLSLYYAYILLNKNIYFWGSVAVTVLVFILNWHPKIPQTSSYEFAPPDNLSYQDLIIIGKQAAQFVSINYPSAHVYGHFPESYQLTETYQGYVSQPLHFSECKDFKLEADTEQIIYIHPYSPGQMICRQLLDLVPVKPLQHFESNGKWVEIYHVQSQQIPKTAVPS